MQQTHKALLIFDDRPWPKQAAGCTLAADECEKSRKEFLIAFSSTCISLCITIYTTRKQAAENCMGIWEYLKHCTGIAVVNPVELAARKMRRHKLDTLDLHGMELANKDLKPLLKPMETCEGLVGINILGTNVWRANLLMKKKNR